MKRLRPLTRPAQAVTKQDPFGAVFFQIWLSVFTAILGTAFKNGD
jgi:hypothetical protein